MTNGVIKTTQTTNNPKRKVKPETNRTIKMRHVNNNNNKHKVGKGGSVRTSMIKCSVSTVISKISKGNPPIS